MNYRALINRLCTAYLFIVFLSAPVTASTESAPIEPGWSEVSLSSGQFSNAPTPDWVQVVDTPGWSTPAPLALRVWDQQYRFGPQSTDARYTRMVIEGQDAAQLKQQGRQILAFNPQFERLRLHTLAVWRDGKAIDHLHRTKPRLLTADGASTTVYGGQVSVLLEVLDFRPGDQLEVAWTVEGRNPVFGAQVYAVQEWQRPWPIAQRNLSVLFSADLPLHIDVAPNMEPQASRLQSYIPYEESMEKSLGNGWKRVEYKDNMLPAQRSEENAALGSLQTDLVTISSFKDWPEVALWGEGLFAQPAAPQSAAFKALVAEVQTQATPAEKTAAALRWVQREIRYVSMSLGENSHRPSSPDMVLERRYGDCKDVTLLLTQVLRAVGVEVQPALMFTPNSRLVPQLKAVPWFDHVVAVAWVGGTPYVLDAVQSEQPSQLAHMANWHGRGQVLVVGGPHAGFLTVPVSADIQDRTVLRDESMVVADEGRSGVLSVSITLTGAAAEIQRFTMRTMPKEDVKANVLKQIRQTYPNADWGAEPSYDDDEPLNRIVMAGVFKVPEPLKRRTGGGWRYEFSDAEVTARLGRVENAQRQIPLGLRTEPQRVVFTHTLELPAGWRADEALFNEAIATSPVFTAHVQRSQPAPHKLVDRTELTLHSDTVTVAQMAAYQEAARRVFDMETTVKISK